MDWLPVAASARSMAPVAEPTPKVMPARISMAMPEMIGKTISSRSFWSTVQQIFMMSQVRPMVANM